jgi:hypothetical protein
MKALQAKIATVMIALLVIAPMLMIGMNAMLNAYK